MMTVHCAMCGATRRDDATCCEASALAQGKKMQATAMNYDDIIARKSSSVSFGGIEPGELASHLYPHQRDLARWALRRGRAAVFADTGLGKTAMQIEWARHVAMRGRVLVMAPLAVAQQTVREAERFGVEMVYRRHDEGDAITITNYDMMHHFDLSRFAGVALDESSILKSHDGAFRKALTEGCAEIPYRSAWTATPAPNDFTELGTHAAFLGVKTREEMLAEYFVHDGGSTQDWRLKGHAVQAFWRWLATWGAVVKRPSDLGHDDAGYNLPPLDVIEHVVGLRDEDVRAAGRLFADDAMTLAEQRAVRRSTMTERVAKAAEVAVRPGPCLVWCELNDEGEALADAIPDAVQVAGSDTPDDKASRLLGFASGEHRVLISKPSLAGFGLNFQRCARMVFVGASHSYEQTYQAIRRCWRFGQTQRVEVHMIRTEADGQIAQNMKRKEADAARMGAEMTACVGEAVRAEVTGTTREWNPYTPSVRQTVPDWIGKEHGQ